MSALQQVVREDGIFGEAAAQRLFDGLGQVQGAGEGLLLAAAQDGGGDAPGSRDRR